MNKPNIKILVCCHKKDIMATQPPYFPIHVGKAISNVDLGIQGDDTGDNISNKNASYCELTGMYWAWKNLKDVDYIGLCHYRRYFDFMPKKLSRNIYPISDQLFDEKKISEIDVSKLLNGADIILAKPRPYSYNLRTNYCCSHFSKDFYVLAKVIDELYPDYTIIFEDTMEYRNQLNHFNMFISNSKIFKDYCRWLFSILEEVEKRIDISDYCPFQKRIFGYLSERLLYVYVKKNGLKIKYLPVLFYNNGVGQSSYLEYTLKRLKINIQFFFSAKSRINTKGKLYSQLYNCYINK